jgi:hypothetical protein
MNVQDIIERDVRLLVGDLHLQLIMARARITELEEQMADNEKAAKDRAFTPNGKVQQEEMRQ